MHIPFFIVVFGGGRRGPIAMKFQATKVFFRRHVDVPINLADTHHFLWEQRFCRFLEYLTGYRIIYQTELVMFTRSFTKG